MRPSRFAVFTLTACFSLHAATITITTDELTRAASFTTIAVNALEIKTHLARVKSIAGHLFHRKAKSVVNPRPDLNPPGATLNKQGFPVAWPTPDCVGSACKAQ